jgi:competence ComEA-like helix-hairpin-helix protein
MATPAERKALLFFGIVAALGAGTRVFSVERSRTPADARAREALNSQLEAADSARNARFGKVKGRARKKPTVPARPPAKVDLDIASEAEIEALRGIGPSLARRIVADRDSFGPFGSMDGFQRVRGVGPSLVAKLDSTVTFSLLQRPINTVVSGRSGRPVGPPRHRPRRDGGRLSVDSSGSDFRPHR